MPTAATTAPNSNHSRPRQRAGAVTNSLMSWIRGRSGRVTAGSSVSARALVVCAIAAGQASPNATRPAETTRPKRGTESEECRDAPAVPNGSALFGHRINGFSNGGLDNSSPRIRFARTIRFRKDEERLTRTACRQREFAVEKVTLTISPGWLSANSSRASCRDATAATRLRPSPLPPTVRLLSER